jgi:hypothetical protein
MCESKEIASGDVLNDVWMAATTWETQSQPISDWRATSGTQLQLWADNLLSSGFLRNTNPGFWVDTVQYVQYREGPENDKFSILASRAKTVIYRTLHSSVCTRRMHPHLSRMQCNELFFYWLHGCMAISKDGCVTVSITTPPRLREFIN